MKQKTITSVLIYIFLILVTLPSTVCSCGQSGNLITEGGSTTIQPVAELLAEAYMKKNPGVTVDIKGGGSSVGISSVMNGIVDIGAVSREISEKEASMGLNIFVLAKDGIAMVVHPSQTVSDLSLQNIQDIFSGAVTNWNQVGGADREIHVVAREEGSGTRTAFEELVMHIQDGGPLIIDTAILQSSNGAIRTTVAGDEAAIGFLSFGYLDSSVKAVSIDGVAARVDNALSGTYPVVRPLLFVTRGEPKGQVKDFIDFCLGPEGQEIVGQEYISVH